MIAQLPPANSSVYENVVLSVISQCVKAELLAANSWRVAVSAGADPAGPLLGHVKALEATRRALLDRLSESAATQFDRACSESGLPEPVIAALLGVSSEEMWDIRTRGVIPPAALTRVRAFLDAQGVNASAQ